MLYTKPINRLGLGWPGIWPGSWLSMTALADGAIRIRHAGVKGGSHSRAQMSLAYPEMARAVNRMRCVLGPELCVYVNRTLVLL